MKKCSIVSVILLALTFSASTEARDLTYKFGVGYKEAYTNALVDDAGTFEAAQFHGLQATYGLARYIQVGAFFGFNGNFDSAAVGPTVRYDFQTLLSRSPLLWEHLNIFVEGAFLVKLGSEIEEGITLHAPYVGFEILPFKANFFAIHTAAGLVVDFVEENRFGFTNSMFGDVGVKYYF